MLSLGRREEEQEIKNRMSENQKTILNIKKRKSKQFILQLANPHEHTYKKQETIYYCIVFGILLSKTKKKTETLLLCKTMCENNLKVIIYIYIYYIKCNDV